VRIVTGIAIGAYGGVTWEGDHPCNLATWFRKHPQFRAILEKGVGFAGRSKKASFVSLNRSSMIDVNATGPVAPESRQAAKGEHISMLKSIDPILNADVLHALRAMGHGDDLVICDTNFPADSVARQTVLGRLLRIDNVTAGRAARAILSVMPLDSFVEHPALRMEIVGRPHEVPAVQVEVQKEIDTAEERAMPMGSIERFAFYDLAKKAYCVIQTGERRFYGCFVFKKGVIAPDTA
jgi:L-fucose mutarotase